ncbi:type II secretion system protein N [Coralloluteibacterium thermophilus]|uniref:Type II secretion system protein N n=1 Tax=Coralloluteibacterium thermophilum TaxID=2707049 RepID=A0ABV9NMN2_9GAMM
MRRVLLALAGLAVFAAALVAFLPAAVALRWLAPPLPDLVLEDPQGTIWNGRVGRVLHQGQELGELRWVARRSALLEGAYAADFVLEGPAEARGHLYRSFRDLRLRDVDARAPALLFDGALGPGLRPQGEIALSLAHAHWRDDRLVAIDGRADWRRAALGGALAARLGEIRAVFADTGDGRVRGEVEARDGALDISGGFDTGPAGWRLDLLLASREPAIVRVLQWFGEPAGPGRRRLRMEGAWATATS